MLQETDIYYYMQKLDAIYLHFDNREYGIAFAPTVYQNYRHLLYTWAPQDVITDIKQ